MHIVFSWKNGPPAQELRQDAPDRPHVNCLGVLLPRQHDLRCPVPSGCNIFRQEALLERNRRKATPGLQSSLPQPKSKAGIKGVKYKYGTDLIFVGPGATSETQIADFQVAVGVDQEIAGLEISVHDVGGVDVLEAAEDLVHEILHVFIRERLVGDDDLVQVRVHEFRHDVDVLEVLVGFRFHNVQQVDDLCRTQLLGVIGVVGVIVLFGLIGLFRLYGVQQVDDLQRIAGAHVKRSLEQQENKQRGKRKKITSIAYVGLLKVAHE